MTSGSIGHQEDETVLTVVGLTNIPEAIRRLDTLASPDYVDLFTATTSGATDKSAEEWARALLEDTPTGRSAPVLWRLLGLRLGPTPSPDYVQGWQIADRGEDWIRIETASWFMTTHGVVQIGNTHVSLALFVRYDRPSRRPHLAAGVRPAPPRDARHAPAGIEGARFSKPSTTRPRRSLGLT